MLFHVVFWIITVDHTIIVEGDNLLGLNTIERELTRIINLCLDLFTGSYTPFWNPKAAILDILCHIAGVELVFPVTLCWYYSYCLGGSVAIVTIKFVSLR